MNFMNSSITLKYTIGQPRSFWDLHCKHSFEKNIQLQRAHGVKEATGIVRYRVTILNSQFESLEWPGLAQKMVSMNA